MTEDSDLVVEILWPTSRRFTYLRLLSLLFCFYYITRTHTQTHAHSLTLNTHFYTHTHIILYICVVSVCARARAYSILFFYSSMTRDRAPPPQKPVCLRVSAQVWFLSRSVQHARPPRHNSIVRSSPSPFRFARVARARPLPLQVCISPVNDTHTHTHTGCDKCTFGRHRRCTHIDDNSNVVMDHSILIRDIFYT